MKSRILSLENVTFQKRPHGASFECQIAPVGVELDSRKLGFNVTVIFTRVKDGVDYWEGELQEDRR